MGQQLVEVRFKGNRKGFYRWHEPEPLGLEDPVIVETDRGFDLGRVSATGPVAVVKCSRCSTSCRAPQPHGEDTAPFADDVRGESAFPEAVPAGGAEAAAAPPEPERRVVRRATATDLKTAADLRHSENDVRRRVRERAEAFHLAMKVSDAEWQWDRNKLTVYFTAERRVDFRNLVRDLASVFRTRIELRQIGVRDEAKRLDGIGRCGRQLCCTWLPELRPIGLQIAKDQSLSLNPSQISGACGRLLCCLRYEHEFYVQSRKRFPKEGRILTTSHGAERVVAIDLFRERVTLRGEDGASRIVLLAELKQEVEVAAGPAPEPAAGPAPEPAAGPASEPAAGPAPEPPAGGARKRGHRGGRRRRHSR